MSPERRAFIEQLASDTEDAALKEAGPDDPYNADMPVSGLAAQALRDCLREIDRLNQREDAEVDEQSSAVNGQTQPSSHQSAPAQEQVDPAVSRPHSDEPAPAADRRNGERRKKYLQVLGTGRYRSGFDRRQNSAARQAPNAAMRYLTQHGERLRAAARRDDAKG